MNRFLERSRIVASDAVALFRTILSNKIMPQQQSSSLSTPSIKTILLEQANVPYQNQFAIKLLHYEKEFNLIRYHGFLEYSKNKLLSSQFRLVSNISNGGTDQIGSGVNNNIDNTTTVSANVNTGNTDPTAIQNENINELSTLSTNQPTTEKTTTSSTTTTKVAKIAFMITTSMRNELTTRLQYDTNDIKTMAPIEASLILQHNVLPSDRNSTVPILIEQYEKEQVEIRKQIEQEEIERKEIERNDRLRLKIIEENDKEKLRLQNESIEEIERLTEHHESTTTIPAHSVIRSSDAQVGNKKRLWFELVKIQNSSPSNDNNAETSAAAAAATTTSEVIGLYTTEKEAVFGLETHQYFANREQQREAKLTLKDKSKDTNGSCSVHSIPTYEIRESWR
jgi:hypothetical protein